MSCIVFLRPTSPHPLFRSSTKPQISRASWGLKGGAKITHRQIAQDLTHRAIIGTTPGFLLAGCWEPRQKGAERCQNHKLSLVRGGSCFHLFFLSLSLRCLASCVLLEEGACSRYGWGSRLLGNWDEGKAGERYYPNRKDPGGRCMGFTVLRTSEDWISRREVDEIGIPAYGEGVHGTVR